MTPELSAWTTKRLGEYDKALVTAAHFGFRPILAPKITRKDIEITKDCNGSPYYYAADRMAMVRTYVDSGLSSLPHPLTFVYKRRFEPRNTAEGYALHFIGSQSGIAEATLIRTTLSMLSEAGAKNIKIDINCVGDRDSLGTYERELINYVRKYGGQLSEDTREHVRNDIFNIFKIESDDMKKLRETAPSTITFLSASSRNYFKEVLEYLEALGIEFRLAPELLGEKNHSSHTIFSIKESGEEGERTLAVGYRYSRLARFLGLRKEIPMAGVNIMPSSAEKNTKVYKDLPKPKFYLVQLGEVAKVKTLSLIELLRTNRIPVYHFPGKDKLTAQLLNAESLKTPYLIIIGQKEAIDNTATVRNVVSRAQDTINVSELPNFLRKISL